VSQLNYLNDLVCEMLPELGFAQEAVVHAVLVGTVKLTHDKQADMRLIMDGYDKIIEDYRLEQQANLAALVESYTPLMEAIRDQGRMFPQATPT
jgi:hypothetical protein